MHKFKKKLSAPKKKINMIEMIQKKNSSSLETAISVLQLPHSVQEEYKLEIVNFKLFVAISYDAGMVEESLGEETNTLNSSA